MSVETSRITIHMVASLDGFIAKPDGSTTWMHSTDEYENGKTLTPEEIEAYLKGIDCYVMGSHTYEHALELGWPYGETPVKVLTSRSFDSERRNVSFHAGDLPTFVEKELKTNYQNIWMVGGAMTTKAFLQADLADQIIITIMPILLGEGTLFFDFIGREQRLHLKDVTAYKEGMVELTYEVLKT